MSKITETITKAGSLRAAWPKLQKLGLDPVVLATLAEVVEADSLLMASRSKESKLEFKNPKMHADIVRIAASGETVQKVYDAVVKKYGDGSPSKATVHRIMREARRQDRYPLASVLNRDE